MPDIFVIATPDCCPGLQAVDDSLEQGVVRAMVQKLSEFISDHATQFHLEPSSPEVDCNVDYQVFPLEYDQRADVLVVIILPNKGLSLDQQEKVGKQLEDFVPWVNTLPNVCRLPIEVDMLCRWVSEVGMTFDVTLGRLINRR
jgi:hypothetical protein